MKNPLALVAMAVVVAAIAFAASWMSSHSIWLSIILIGSGVLASGFVDSLFPARPRTITTRQPSNVTDDEAEQTAPTVLAIRFVIGTAVLSLMTVSLLWFLGTTGN